MSEERKHVCYDGIDLGVFSVIYITSDQRYISTVAVAYDRSEATRNAVVRMERVPDAARLHSVTFVGMLYDLLTCRTPLSLMILQSWSELQGVEPCQ